MLEPQDKIRFEQIILPHLNSATNLARWLLRTRADSEDAVQEAMYARITCLALRSTSEACSYPL